jgi:hypothetical protein
MPGSHTGLTFDGAHAGIGGDGGTEAGAHSGAHGGGGVNHGDGGMGRPNVAGGGGGGGLHSLVAGFHNQSFWHGDEPATVTTVIAPKVSIRTAAR